VCYAESAYSYQGRRSWDVGRSDFTPPPLPQYASKLNPYVDITKWQNPPSALQQYYYQQGYSFVSDPRGGAVRGYDTAETANPRNPFVPTFSKPPAPPRPPQTKEEIAEGFDAIKPTRANYEYYQTATKQKKEFANYELLAIAHLANAYQDCILEEAKIYGIEIQKRQVISSAGAIIGTIGTATANPIGIVVGLLGTAVSALSNGNRLTKEFQEYQATQTAKLTELAKYYSFYEGDVTKKKNNTLIITALASMVGAALYRKWKQQ
jgi:hypothetical protein